VVSPEFSADGSFVTSEYRSNLCLSMGGLLQCIDLVSFFLGELRVGSHQCSFDFVVYVALLMLPQLAS
jgi:hypothetical protein